VIKASVEMTITPEGSINFHFNGPPLHLNTFWYGMLEAAKDQVRTAVTQKEMERIMAPAPSEVIAFGAFNK